MAREVEKTRPRRFDLMTFWPWLQKSTKLIPGIVPAQPSPASPARTFADTPNDLDVFYGHKQPEKDVKKCDLERMIIRKI